MIGDWCVLLVAGIRGMGLRHPPTPLFLQVFIPKGFKSCVLEVLILGELQAVFAEVRILNGLGAKEATGMATLQGNRKQKRQRDAGATVTRRNVIQKLLYAQSNQLSSKKWNGG